MLVIRDYSDILNAMQKVIANSLMKNLFDDHTLREVRELDNGIIIPGPSQTFLDPLRIGNMVYMDLRKKIWDKKKIVIMNKDGGYQPYDPDVLESMGWKEIRREKREQLSFHKYTNAPV